MSSFVSSVASTISSLFAPRAVFERTEKQAKSIRALKTDPDYAHSGSDDCKMLNKLASATSYDEFSLADEEDKLTHLWKELEKTKNGEKARSARSRAYYQDCERVQEMVLSVKRHAK
ncbi:hypothetical protein I302_108731 [Kwoniella bestiolae CBS 10118]|uniref:Uncharacterized protein n=1 Tax=Kwoniella bestiolae CBS 10118 TaxID=1296100 RepID=A0A1B9FTY2_9TREE|nr:hypothetical protein I302_07868 [Kwoniella bestiolae CBS 10118]OCF22223.1 hypothetical protein I302_07868 [Kwoniella bestiolae CBS 10118]